MVSNRNERGNTPWTTTKPCGRLFLVNCVVIYRSITLKRVIRGQEGVLVFYERLGMNHNILMCVWSGKGCCRRRKKIPRLVSDHHRYRYSARAKKKNLIQLQPTISVDQMVIAKTNILLSLKQTNRHYLPLTSINKTYAQYLWTTEID